MFFFENVSTTSCAYLKPSMSDTFHPLTSFHDRLLAIKYAMSESEKTTHHYISHEDEILF